MSEGEEEGRRREEETYKYSASPYQERGRLGGCRGPRTSPPRWSPRLSRCMRASESTGVQKYMNK